MASQGHEDLFDETTSWDLKQDFEKSIEKNIHVLKETIEDHETLVQIPHLCAAFSYWQMTLPCG